MKRALTFLCIVSLTAISIPACQAPPDEAPVETLRRPLITPPPFGLVVCAQDQIARPGQLEVFMNNGDCYMKDVQLNNPQHWFGVPDLGVLATDSYHIVAAKQSYGSGFTDFDKWTGYNMTCWNGVGVWPTYFTSQFCATLTVTRWNTQPYQTISFPYDGTAYSHSLQATANP